MEEKSPRADGTPPIALTIAGSDSGGGAGVQADLKTFHQFGVYGTSVLVAVTAQNTKGVTDVCPIPPDTVRSQIAAVAGDLPPLATKTGMLATAELVMTVAQSIGQFRLQRLVVDPVMVATSGDRLLSRDAEQSVIEELIPLAAVVTPNLHEAQLLLGESVDDVADMERAGRLLLERGAGAALVKGGHLDCDHLIDVLITADGTYQFAHSRINTTSTHGTGCTLSAAITAGLALGEDLVTAVDNAIEFVQRAISHAPRLGGGHGPLNHFVPVRSQ